MSSPRRFQFTHPVWGATLCLSTHMPVSYTHLVAPFELRVEGPVDMDAREPQIEALAKIRELLDAKGSKCQIVADEWCNTLEDIIAFSERKARCV